MLRYFYLLSLLICFNLSFCYEYSSDKDSSRRSSISKLKADYRIRRDKLQHRKHRKRHDYDMYDKDPVAEIDVASFINSADEDSISENDPYDLQYRKRQYERDNNYDKLTNEISNREDYSEMDEESLQEASKYMNNNPLLGDKISDKFTHRFDKVLNNNLDTNEIKQYNKPNKEKKCALKNFKFPFFSHNKSAIDKGKNIKKSKLHGFNNARKGNVVYRSDEIISKENSSRDKSNIYKHDNINKRSYIERLCPVCRKNFIVRQSSKPQSKRSNNLNNMYNLRQNKNSPDSKRNLIKSKADTITLTSSDKDIFENVWNDRKRKRENDDRNIERQKELEYIEKRVEGVAVNNPSYNKNKL